jgi:hypothetical protein
MRASRSCHRPTEGLREWKWTAFSAVTALSVQGEESWVGSGGPNHSPALFSRCGKENIPSRSSSMKTGAAKVVRCVDVKPSRKHMLIAE